MVYAGPGGSLPGQDLHLNRHSKLRIPSARGACTAGWPTAYARSSVAARKSARRAPAPHVSRSCRRDSCQSRHRRTCSRSAWPRVCPTASCHSTAPRAARNHLRSPAAWRACSPPTASKRRRFALTQWPGRRHGTGTTQTKGAASARTCARRSACCRARHAPHADIASEHLDRHST